MQFKKNLVQSIVWRGFYLFTSVLLNLVIAQVFGAETTGLIYYNNSFFSLIILIAGLNIETGIAFYAAQQKIAPEKLVSIAILWAVCSSILSLLFMRYIYKGSAALVPGIPYFIAAFTYILGLQLVNFFSALFYAGKSYTLPNYILGICNFFIVLIGIIAFFSIKQQKIKQLFLQCYFWGFLVQGVVLAFVYRRKYITINKWQLPNKAELILVLKFSLITLLGNTIYFLLYRIDYWFIQNTCQAYPKEEITYYLGNYIQVAKTGQLFLLLPATIASAIFPSTASGMKDQINKRIPYLVKIIMAIYTVAGIVIAITGKKLFPFIYGISFNHMYFPFLLLFPGIMALSIVGLLTAYNSGNNNVKLNVIGAAVSLIVIVVGDWIFIPRYGIIAAAIVSSVGYFAYLALLLYFFRKEYKGKMKDIIIPSKEDLAIFRNLLILPWK